ncbi:MAG: hypothetical protein K0S27_1668 [Gammaproteobacteria bacterium]|jgi:hypothetical protein|nr:hypothetical protein [Gammaproteobacteria bacterium]
MFEDAFLSVSGHAYLHAIQRYQSDEWYATFNLIYELNDSRSDNVWLECRFNKDQFPLFAQLDHHLIEKRSIIVKFDAKYCGFQQCYAGITENDPRFIVQIHGELLKVHEYYVEGVKAFYHHLQDRQNHPLLQEGM